MEEKHSGAKLWLIATDQTNRLHYVTCHCHGRKNGMKHWDSALLRRCGGRVKTYFFIAFNTVSFPSSVPYFSKFLQHCKLVEKSFMSGNVCCVTAERKEGLEDLNGLARR